MMPTAAILAGGAATRLYPATRKVAKSMLEVAGRPFIDHQLDLLRRGGVGSVVICSGCLGGQIKEHVGDGSRFGLSVRFSDDGDRPLGTGGALKKALPLLGGDFFVMYGDSYLPVSFGGVAAAYRAAGRPGLMTVYRNGGKWDRSNVLFRGGEIVRYDKTASDRDMEHIDYGLGVLSPEAFGQFSDRDAFDLAEVYAALIASKGLFGLEVTERFYEIGSPQGLVETDAYLSGLKER